MSMSDNRLNYEMYIQICNKNDLSAIELISFNQRVLTLKYTFALFILYSFFCIK